jgi:hypothetical protein
MRRAPVSKLQKTQRSRGIFATALGLLVVVQTLFLITGCSRIPSATFQNPKFHCPSSDVVEPGVTYPYPIQQYSPPPQQKPVAELKDFCAEMKQRFANSNMTNKEAKQFYALLKESNEMKGSCLMATNYTFIMKPMPCRAQSRRIHLSSKSR